MLGSDQFLTIASPVAVLIIWELVGRLNLIDSRFFPPPSSILDIFWKLTATGELPMHVGMSVMRIALGFALGCIPGVFLGLSMGLFRPLRVVVNPLVGLMYPLPKISLIPIVLLLLGYNETSKLIMVALGCFWLVVINTMVGVLNIEKAYLDVAHSFNARKKDLYLRVVLPGALPVIFAGLRLALGMAILGAVAVEFLASNDGIGYLIWHSWQIFSMKTAFVGLALVAVLGFLLFAILDRVARIALPWKAEI